jgi:hypothetical protein
MMVVNGEGTTARPIILSASDVSKSYLIYFALPKIAFKWTTSAQALNLGSARD